MYRIAICDDESTSLALNKSLTEHILKEEGITFEISTFQDMNEMIKVVTSETKPYDVLLSDILTTGMNGIEAAEKLRELGEKMAIIFISSTADFALDGYRVNALRYLQKPVNVERLREALLKAYSQAREKGQIIVTVADKVYRVAYSDILYLESKARDVHLYLKEGSLIARMKFSEAQKLLPDQMFVRCHRSYIVNIQYVVKVERYQATITNQLQVPISQAQYSGTKKQFLQFKP